MPAELLVGRSPGGGARHRVGSVTVLLGVAFGLLAGRECLLPRILAGVEEESARQLLGKGPSQPQQPSPASANGDHIGADSRNLFPLGSFPPDERASPGPFPPLTLIPAEVAPSERKSGKSEEGGPFNDFDRNLRLTTCESCGGGSLGLPPPAGDPGGPGGAGPGCGCCGCNCGHCYPGQQPCCPCFGNTCLGRICCALYDCVACPDPCYEGRWLPLANAAFFVEQARPQTQQWIGYDSAQHYLFPDRGEYFWAREGPQGKGPTPPSGILGEAYLNYNQLSFYSQAATGKLGIFFEVPYLSIQPKYDPYASGFGNINFGTKSLMVDCELLQLSFQFRTFTPTGNFTKGLGNGLWSLEPSLLAAVKLGPITYFQGQLSEWIPLGGDPNYAGSVLHYHTSINQVLYAKVPDMPLVGTLEADGWSFQHGAFSDPRWGQFQKLSGQTDISAGGGLRLYISYWIDIGIGATYGIGYPVLQSQLYRAQFRWRF
jgi:hypothetical protein